MLLLDYTSPVQPQIKVSLLCNEEEYHNMSVTSMFAFAKVH